jgi:HEAT repeat protein
LVARAATLGLVLSWIAVGSTACRSASPSINVSPEDVAVLRGSWKLYVDHDPHWPQAKREWIAKGDDALKLLVENLRIEIVRGLDLGDTARRDRAETELVDLGPPAVPHLIEAIRAGDDVVGKQCAIVIGRIGAPATDAVLAALPSAKPRERMRLYEAMGGIGGERVGDPLRRALSTEEDWRLRAAAATALGRAKSPGAYEALLAATRDEDPFVRSRAAAALGDLGDRRAVGRLVALLETSHASASTGEAAVVHESAEALRALTGQALGEDPRAWREWQSRQSDGR